MKFVELGKTGMQVSAITVGCMRINSIEVNEAAKLIELAVENQVNYFDHADIYDAGECESTFQKALALTDIKREDLILQSKCGIVPGVMHDFSKKHILKSVEGSLKRLNTEYLDVLLLHRPDALVEPEEVAEAFDELYESGKVKYFGVSNQNPMQIELLKKFVRQPLVANQLQVSLAHSGMISNGVEMNMLTDRAICRDGSILDYSRLHDMTIQAWSPFQYGSIEGPFLGSDKFPVLNQKIDEMAQKYDVTNTTIAVAWLLRHPANMQVISGTMTQKRFTDICKATEIQMSREDWYELYVAAGNILP
ncbi:putative oxidoreductase [Aequitasia blattaphilus]|uniref:Aldo/keto reductase n=1 Tax=Aequitasia blattaphilus TaxID=2949332 RepID=A0ABT1EEV8_9FIRM|nr:aldo/keto reductase [Aequitasia blattaphilus]MCP1102997.1 aldo/keto reductase [Aequitasia blattaphilus]MCR8615637.1 aldo/keto reductase [Aequitasia blattaphilus]